jgi:hypothetical protein
MQQAQRDALATHRDRAVHKEPAAGSAAAQWPEVIHGVVAGEVQRRGVMHDQHRRLLPDPREAGVSQGAAQGRRLHRGIAQEPVRTLSRRPATGGLWNGSFWLVDHIAHHEFCPSIEPPVTKIQRRKRIGNPSVHSSSRDTHA